MLFQYAIQRCSADGRATGRARAPTAPAARCALCRSVAISVRTWPPGVPRTGVGTSISVLRSAAPPPRGAVRNLGASHPFRVGTPVAVLADAKGALRRRGAEPLRTVELRRLVQRIRSHTKGVWLVYGGSTNCDVAKQAATVKRGACAPLRGEIGRQRSLPAQRGALRLRGGRRSPLPRPSLRQTRPALILLTITKSGRESAEANRRVRAAAALEGWTVWQMEAAWSYPRFQLQMGSLKTFGGRSA